MNVSWSIHENLFIGIIKNILLPNDKQRYSLSYNLTDESSISHFQDRRGIPAPGLAHHTESIYMDYDILFKNNKQFWITLILKFILTLCDSPKQYIRPQFLQKNKSITANGEAECLKLLCKLSTNYSTSAPKCTQGKERSRFTSTLKQAFERKDCLPPLQRVLNIPFIFFFLFFPRKLCLNHIYLPSVPPFLMPRYKSYSLWLLLLNVTLNEHSFLLPMDLVCSSDASPLPTHQFLQTVNKWTKMSNCLEIKS